MRHLPSISKLTLTVVMLALPMLVAAQLSDNEFKFLKGEGSEQKPYLINSYEALVEFRELAALQKLERNYHVSITADIDLGADPNWAPIRYYDPQDSLYFQGLVDGHGHTLYHLTVNKRIDAVRSDKVYLGLFGRTNGTLTILKNINLDHVSIDVSLEANPENALDIHAGALVGYSRSVLQNVNVNGVIRIVDESDQTSSTRNVNVGGIAGTLIDDGTMGNYTGTDGKPCDLNADIDISSGALGSRIGGITGNAEKVDFARCTTSGMLTGRLVAPESPIFADDWKIYIGGICGYSKNHDVSFTYEGLCSVCRVYGGNESGGLIGHLYASFPSMSSHVTLKNCYAAGGVSDAYSYSGGMIGRITKYGNSNVQSTFSLTNCYYAGTLTTLSKGKSKAMIGSYNGNGTLTEYSMVNCFYDNRMMNDDTDYKTLMFGESGTNESMTAYICGYDTQKAIGTNSPFKKIIAGGDDDDEEMEWVFAEGRYPQLKSIKDTPVSTLAVVPIYFKGNENAERVYLGATLPEASVNGKQAQWSAPLGYGSVAGQRLMSDAVGYEILTLTADNCAKRLNLYMANSDEKWEGEAHIPTGEKFEVFASGNGTSHNPYVIMNAGQLAFAVKHNTINEYYQVGHDIIINRNLLSDVSAAIPWIDTKKATYQWKANLDGDGFVVRGMYLPMQSETDQGYHHGLLGSIAENAHVENLGVVETVITDDFSQITTPAYVGAIAGSVSSDATLDNCFTSGYIMLKAQQGMLFAGGICGQTAGSITDCLNAVAVMSTERDVMVPNNQLGGIAAKAEATATFSNCLNIGRISHIDSHAHPSTGGICPTASATQMTDCHYDLQMTSCADNEQGMTTTDMTNGTFFSGKSRWTSASGHYPVLQRFAKSDHMKMLSQPLIFSDDDCSASMTYILELPLGGIRWSLTDGAECLNLFTDHGLAEPKATGTALLTAEMNSAKGQDKSWTTSFITVPSNFTMGIKFVDPNAERACLDAFGTNGILTLQQAMSITDFSPFVNHASTPSIIKFPEMRYFTKISKLTSQLSSCTSLEEVELPLGLKTISANAFAGCQSLKTVTLPVNLTSVEPYAFRNSNIKEIQVHTSNSRFVSRDGVLFDDKEYIVAYPAKRDGESYLYTNPLHGIYTGAFQGIEQLQKLYLGDDEGTFIDLRKNAIPTDMQVFINDATDNSDYIDYYYRYDESRDWQYIDEKDNLHRYFPLKVTSAQYATMCIYFDTELPQGVSAYYCCGVDGQKEGDVLFRLIGRQVPNGLPVLIHANKAGIYPLLPYEGRIEETVLEDQSNYFQGSGEHGTLVGDQSASSGTQEGSILTLGHNSQGTLGFYFYQNNTNKIPAYRAYLVVDPLLAANGFTISLDDNNGIDTPSITDLRTESPAIYDLTGRKVAEGIDIHRLPRGIYIQNSRKIQVK